MARIVKREPGTSRSRAEIREEAGRSEPSARQAVSERRVLRSRYLVVKNLIDDEREDISRADSDKFNSIIGEVENLHQLVQKPREQVVDAEALLDIANTLVTSVKSHGNDGVTPSDFVTALLGSFGRQDGASSSDGACSLVSWTDIGLAVSHVFKKAPGFSTMIGPMSTELKQRKTAVQRKRTRPTESTRPEEVEGTGEEEKTDTDKNMSTMFDILRKKKRVRLENLVLNRSSFAQTVENIFALSFLVKDGRAEITVNDDRHHFVLPRNAPSANALASGEVSYSHFVFRFDFKDWVLMKRYVGVGEELMPHRHGADTPSYSQMLPIPEDDVQAAGPTTPIRKLSRNRGLVIQEESVVDDTPEKADSAGRASKRKGKRTLRDLGIN
ncbi:non-structural maintenance of chromosomes element 4 homolog A isoform X2 [Magnolia sinica]|uniref:non-structural maintenance of chromosomes element 4 homolog A isoform X2 n=1 Tax=Magnolia sinica TaxID=86752 RepID=UPI002658BFC3|nr:non-structural maintenance of chromosomes element 4 homolog A isoform X2 [Magnolia sinica]